MNTYDEPTVITYQTSVNWAVAGDELGFVGPAGKRGRIVAVTAVPINNVQTNDAGVVVKGMLTQTTKASLVVPVGSDDEAGLNDTVFPDGFPLIEPNEVMVIEGTGSATAGTGTVFVTVAWF